MICVGKRLVCKIIKKDSPYFIKALIALWVMELFLGIGQIWFYSVEHLTAWTIIYLVDHIYDEKQEIPKEKYKYVKA